MLDLCAFKLKFHGLEKQQQRALVQNNRGADKFLEEAIATLMAHSRRESKGVRVHVRERACVGENSGMQRRELGERQAVSN